ncbi:type II toxin-antitoxin system RelB/DinJ family antitoxin [Enterobacteriaceae bacterium BIT-l23]|uniref:type II toxin-antitoxin system RelB/DinJ family antitoxin n=1 Tax=Jejubacter sp. L23 TaxID=3092086 RepID=UPI001585CF6B|nr:type II toxin-antitoxin system RelB/DinJ family antitoxin [Enterobacteriaceae bacterium BIT-l23]
MVANSLVQARIDTEVKEQASAVLEKMGLTVSDAVRILLTRIASEGGLPVELTTDPQIYDAWFRAKVRETLDDSHSDVPDDKASAQFAARKEALRKKIR